MKFLRHASILCLIGLPGFAVAQPAQEPPLSVIDWLGERPKSADPRNRPHPSANEAAVATSALPPPVTVTKLGTGSPRAIGLVPPAVTGLAHDIWTGSSVGEISELLSNLPDLQLPASRALLYTLLLAEATAPQSNAQEGDALALVRVKTLMDAGALDPALSLIEQAGVATSPKHFALWMQISLLLGTEDRACQLLLQKPYLSTDFGVRILCAARSGKWDNAALTLGSAQALQLLPVDDLSLLDRFLNPDLYDGSAPLPPPRTIDPLNFRLLEAIGEPQPTRSLPPAFAVADLRDIVGWKAQLEAAERLTRIGALPDNRFLGIYTARAPAASGGIWDRVAALQRFDVALGTGSAEAIAKTLRPAWRAMQDAELEVSFATLYAEPLQKIALEGATAALRDRLVLLSPLYEAVAMPDTPSPEMAFLTAIAHGGAPKTVPDIPHADAIAAAFQAPSPRQDLLAAAKDSQLGVTILRTIALLEDGARGDTAALRDALSTLRALGLEDTARRASLQALILDRS